MFIQYVSGNLSYYYYCVNVEKCFNKNVEL